MRLPRIPRYTRYEKLITAIILLFLFVHAFLPKYINLDKYTMMLIGFLLLVAIMPSVTSAKLPYLLEVKRKLSNKESLSGQDLKKLEKTFKELKRIQKEAAKDYYISKNESEKLMSLSNKLLKEIKNKN